MNNHRNNDFTMDVPFPPHYCAIDNLQPVPGIFSHASSRCEQLPIRRDPSTMWTQTVPTSMPWLQNGHMFQGFTAQSPVNAHGTFASSAAHAPQQEGPALGSQDEGGGYLRSGCRRKRITNLDECVCLLFSFNAGGIARRRWSVEIHSFRGPVQKHFFTAAKMAERFNMMHIDDKCHDVPVVVAEQQQARAQLLSFEEIEQRYTFFFCWMLLFL